MTLVLAGVLAFFSSYFSHRKERTRNKYLFFSQSVTGLVFGVCFSTYLANKFFNSSEPMIIFGISYGVCYFAPEILERIKRIIGKNDGKGF